MVAEDGPHTAVARLIDFVRELNDVWGQAGLVERQQYACETAAVFEELKAHG